jgi:hypothetical protein
VVAGPFADRIDADWAAFADGLLAVSVFGSRHADGTVAPRPSPQERAWLSDLGDQLDRLPRDWDELLTDTDPLTTLVVEIAAALIEADLTVQQAMNLAIADVLGNLGFVVEPVGGTGGSLVTALR